MSFNKEHEQSSVDKCILDHLHIFQERAIDKISLSFCAKGSYLYDLASSLPPRDSKRHERVDELIIYIKSCDDHILMILY